MRIAVLIIGLVLTVGLFIQAAIISGLSDAINDENTGQAAAIGVMMAFMWLIACGLVIPLPRVSLVLFLVAGVLGIAASGNYPDLAIWGGISFFLALMSFFGFRGKRNSKAKEDERDSLLRQMVAHQAAFATASGAYPSPSIIEATTYSTPLPHSPLLVSRISETTTCPSCSASVNTRGVYCAECGFKYGGSTA